MNHSTTTVQTLELLEVSHIFVAGSWLKNKIMKQQVMKSYLRRKFLRLFAY